MKYCLIETPKLILCIILALILAPWAYLADRKAKRMFAVILLLTLSSCSPPAKIEHFEKNVTLSEFEKASNSKFEIEIILEDKW